MGAFDYLLTFVSILFGLAVVDLAVSLHRLLRARSRVRWDWLPLMVGGLVLLLILEFWWSFHHTGQAELWVRYGAFLLLALILLNLFLLASAALPDEIPAEGLDLRVYYSDNQRLFWLLFALYVALTMVSQLVVAYVGGGLSDADPGRWALALLPNAGLVAVALSLAFTRQRAYHGAVLLLLLAGLGWQWSRLHLSP